MSTAPWWATGAFTLAGVLLAQFAAFALNRSRDRFEDSRRWHEDRRDIYLAVVVNAWKIQDAVYNRFELDRPLPDDLRSAAPAGFVTHPLVEPQVTALQAGAGGQMT